MFTGSVPKTSVAAFVATVALLAPPAAAAPARVGPDAATAADSVSAAVKVRTLKLAKLERGPGARVPTLQGRVLRPADGSGAFRVDVPFVQGQARLLGQRADGRWLVAAQTKKVQRVFAVSRDGSHRAVPHTRTTVQRSSRVGWVLSRDGGRLVQTRWGSYFSWQTVRDAVTGEVVKKYSTERAAFPLDADGERLVVRLDAGVRDLVPGVSDTPVVKAANAAVISRDLVFAKVKGLQFGPTALSSPGAPAWTARFAALDVSPDGSLVLGTRLRHAFDRKPRVLELRRMSDGQLVRAFRYGGRTQPRSIHTQDEQTARFESDSRFVFEVRAQKRSVLVRCATGGKCERASGWAPHISVPHEKYVWWRRLNS